MKKMKILLSVIPLLVVPILSNIWLILIYPIYIVFSVVCDEKDFLNKIKIYVDSMAKIDIDLSLIHI